MLIISDFIACDYQLGSAVTGPVLSYLHPLSHLYAYWWWSLLHVHVQSDNTYYSIKFPCFIINQHALDPEKVPQT